MVTLVNFMTPDICLHSLELRKFPGILGNKVTPGNVAETLPLPYLVCHMHTQQAYAILCLNWEYWDLYGVCVCVCVCVFFTACLFAWLFRWFPEQLYVIVCAGLIYNLPLNNYCWCCCLFVCVYSAELKIDSSNFLLCCFAYCLINVVW